MVLIRMKGERKLSTPVVRGKARKRWVWTEKRREAGFGLLFVLPEFAGIALLGVFPLLFSLYLSFTEWDLVGGISSIHFIGLDNFKALLSDDKFRIALQNNMLYTFVSVPFAMAIGLLLAVLIHTSVFFKTYFKVVFFIPYIATTVAVAAVWSALFNPSLGPINRYLIRLGVEDPPKWFGDSRYAIWAVIVIAVWQLIGYVIVIYLAGLTNISDELYEAAEIDGATSGQKFWRITLPMLASTTLFLSITLIVASFKVFDLIAFLTAGGPNNATNVMVYYIYEEGFQHFRMGYASALSWVLFLIIAVISVITWKAQKSQE